jgi:putative lipoprotein (rSAM/lipoprotein system)
MRRSLLRGVSLALGTALSMLGCNMGSEQTVEYGMPHADYDLSGVVVDATNGTPIVGVQVELMEQTATTDAEGKWSIKGEIGMGCRDACTAVAKDVDGEANGAFQDASKDFSPTKVAEGEGWYHGKFDAADVRIEMQPGAAEPGEAPAAEPGDAEPQETPTTEPGAAEPAAP